MQQTNKYDKALICDSQDLLSKTTSLFTWPVFFFSPYIHLFQPSLPWHRYLLLLYLSEIFIFILFQKVKCHRPSRTNWKLSCSFVLWRHKLLLRQGGDYAHKDIFLSYWQNECILERVKLKLCYCDECQLPKPLQIWVRWDLQWKESLGSKYS